MHEGTTPTLPSKSRARTGLRCSTQGLSAPPACGMGTRRRGRSTTVMSGANDAAPCNRHPSHRAFGQTPKPRGPHQSSAPRSSSTAPLRGPLGLFCFSLIVLLYGVSQCFDDSSYVQHRCSAPENLESLIWQPRNLLVQGQNDQWEVRPCRHVYVVEQLRADFRVQSQ